MPYDLIQGQGQGQGHGGLSPSPPRASEPWGSGGTCSHNAETVTPQQYANFISWLLHKLQ